MPLKGIIMKDYYPKSCMREMCDNDTLFDNSRIDDVKKIMHSLNKKIMHSLNFEMKYDDNGHDLAFYKEPVCNFEIHTELFGEGHDQRMNDYYFNVKSRLIKDSDNLFGYHFSNEDFYVFMVAHENKHFYMGGIGLRSLVDKYVYLNIFADSLDMKYIEKELAKMQINDYEQKSRELSLRLFSGKRLTDEQKEFLDYYIFSGTYGTTENFVNNKVKKLGGNTTAKGKYALNRFFVPVSSSNPHYKVYKAVYPLFYKYKILLPLLPFYRLFHGLYRSRRRIITEIKTLVKI